MKINQIVWYQTSSNTNKINLSTFTKFFAKRRLAVSNRYTLKVSIYSINFIKSCRSIHATMMRVTSLALHSIAKRCLITNSCFGQNKISKKSAINQYKVVLRWTNKYSRITWQRRKPFCKHSLTTQILSWRRKRKKKWLWNNLWLKQMIPKLSRSLIARQTKRQLEERL